MRQVLSSGDRVGDEEGIGFIRIGTKPTLSRYAGCVPLSVGRAPSRIPLGKVEVSLCFVIQLVN